MRAERIGWLDLLRGAAALGIVLFHFHHYLGVAHTSFGFVAVDIFFALSGIVLTVKYARDIEGDLGPLEFAAIRLRRLYPMVLITGLFIVALNLAGVPAGTHAEAATTNAWNVFALAPLSDARAGTAFPADPPLWSLWAELAANAVWFAVLKAGRRWMPALGVVSAVLLVAGVLWGNTLHVGWEAGLLPRLIGVARALASFCLGYAMARHTMSVGRSAMLVVAALAAFELVTRLHVAGNGVNELFCAAAGLALLNLVYRLPAPGPVLAATSRWMGMASFPLYLVHVPAGRLAPCFHALPDWAALLLVVAASTLVATTLNEFLVKFVGRIARSRGRAATVPPDNGRMVDARPVTAANASTR